MFYIYATSCLKKRTHLWEKLWLQGWKYVYVYQIDVYTCTYAVFQLTFDGSCEYSSSEGLVCRCYSLCVLPGADDWGVRSREIHSRWQIVWGQISTRTPTVHPWCVCCVCVCVLCGCVHALHFFDTAHQLELTISNQRIFHSLVWYKLYICNLCPKFLLVLRGYIHTIYIILLIPIRRDGVECKLCVCVCVCVCVNKYHPFLHILAVWGCVYLCSVVVDTLYSREWSSCVLVLCKMLTVYIAFWEMYVQLSV